MKTFVEKFREYEASAEQISDYIDIWHNADTNMSIYEFLGMTEEEYIAWVMNPEALEEILIGP